MNTMNRKPLLLAVLLALCLAASIFAQGGGLFAGILYPKTVYDIAQKDQPPLSIKKRFAKGSECAQELLFTFRRAGNNFKYDTYLDVFTKKPYPRLVIKTLRITYGGTERTVMEGATFAIPKALMPLSMIDSRTHRDEWFTDGEFYFTQGIFMRPLQAGKGFPKIDFQKIFGRKNRSDTSFTLTCTYQFDGEAEQTFTADYTARSVSGQYIPPFF